MTTGNTTAQASVATIINEHERLEQFAWLIDHAGNDRSADRLNVLWDWAKEMVQFQDVANRTGKPVEYYQRGRVLRVLYPQAAREATKAFTSRLLASTLSSIHGPNAETILKGLIQDRHDDATRDATRAVEGMAHGKKDGAA
ncbi:MAG: hypothetical protein WBA42_01740 [Mesorhizobium sp.]